MCLPALVVCPHCGGLTFLFPGLPPVCLLCGREVAHA